MIKNILYGVMGLACLAGPVMAQDPAHASREDAVAIVQKAVAAAKAEGKEAVYSAITAKDPRFLDRDLYIFVWDMSANTLAHGANAKMVGKNLADATDTDGKAFAQERLTLAKTAPSFWTDYKWSNPQTKKIEEKSTYCEVYEENLLCAGIYKQ